MAVPFLPEPEDLWPEPYCDPAAELAELEADQGSFTADQLAERLMESDTGWRITSPDQAEWAMSKLAQAKNNLSDLKRQLREYVDRVTSWHRRAAAGPSADATFFEAQLMVYAWVQRAATRGQTKTVKLPSGEVGTRKPGEPEAVIVDPQAVVEWALLHAPDIVKTTHEVLVTELRKAVLVRKQEGVEGLRVVAKHVDADTGEVSYPEVPGTEVREPQPWAKAKPYETR
jgi:hypothetical protein